MYIVLSEREMLLRLLLAAGVGLLFGLEREYTHKPAGIRTHVLISLTACILAIISAYGFGESAMAYGSAFQRVSDPARLLVGILTSVGCIGAGIIWKSPSGSIQGITTTAGVILVTSLGMAAGLGLFFLTFAGAGIGLLVLFSDIVVVKMRQRKKKERNPVDVAREQVQKKMAAMSAIEELLFENEEDDE